MVELQELPWGIYADLTAEAPGACELVDASALMRGVRLSEDGHEEALLTKAAAMAAAPLAALDPVGQRDWAVIATLERAYRRAGAEDLMLLVTSPTAGQWPGVPREAVLADGVLLQASFEYKGHWLQLSRTWLPAGASPLRGLYDRLGRAYAELSETARPGLSEAEAAGLLKRLAPGDGLHLFAAHASGSAPFTPLPGLDGIEEGMVVALHLGAEDRQGHRALVGDTFLARREGLARVTT
ncbi:MAG: hypothetical protein HYY85_05585 [Deltaproteobacteria bacterium]|nr:hypothetical protein [Deltaproteobacteria bacterium]